MSVLKPLIGVINLSKKLNNNDVKTMVIACQNQLNNDVAPLWYLEPWFIISYDDPKKISPRAYPVVFLDAPDTPEALGYHAEMNGKPYARIFVDPVIQNGGAIFYNVIKPQNVTLSSVLSHEIIELFIDRFANIWVDGPKIAEGASYAYEACDPVQGDCYVSLVKNQQVALSNFVLPSWFDLQNPKGNPVDFMKTAPGAFQLARGGYMVVRNMPSKEKEVFGEVKMPDWLYQMKKQAGSRSIQRLSHVHAEKIPWWKYL